MGNRKNIKKRSSKLSFKKIGISFLLLLLNGITVVAQENGLHHKILLVNNHSFNRIEEVADITRESFGKVLKSVNKEVLLAENSSTLTMSFKENELVGLNNKKNVALNMKLLIDNKQVSQNNYFFEKPKNLELSNVKVKLKQISDPTIEVSSTTMAKSV